MSVPHVTGCKPVPQGPRPGRSPGRDPPVGNRCHTEPVSYTHLRAHETVL